MRKNILKKVVTLGLVSIMALSQVTAAFAASKPEVIKPDIATVRSNTSYTYYVRSGMTSYGSAKQMRIQTYYTYSVRGSSTMRSSTSTYSAKTKYMPVQTIISGNAGDHVYYSIAYANGCYLEGSSYIYLPTQWSRFN